MLAVGRDSSDLEWPVCQALLKALNQRPDEQCWIDAASPQTLARLENTHLPMRKLLKMRPDLVAFVREDGDWLALLIAFYGGLDQALSFAALHRYQQQPVEVARSAALRSPLPIERSCCSTSVISSQLFSAVHLLGPSRHGIKQACATALSPATTGTGTCRHVLAPMETRQRCRRSGGAGRSGGAWGGCHSHFAREPGRP